MRKHDVIHKQEVYNIIATPLEEDPAQLAYSQQTQRKFGKVWPCSFRDARAADKHTINALITNTSHPYGGDSQCTILQRRCCGSVTQRRK